MCPGSHKIYSLLSCAIHMSWLPCFWFSPRENFVALMIFSFLSPHLWSSLMTCMFPLSEWGNSASTGSNVPLTRLCVYCSAEKHTNQFFFFLMSYSLYWHTTQSCSATGITGIVFNVLIFQHTKSVSFILQIKNIVLKETHSAHLQVHSFIWSYY